MRRGGVLVHPRTCKQTNLGVCAGVGYARACSHCCLRDQCLGRRPAPSDNGRLRIRRSCSTMLLRYLLQCTSTYFHFELSRRMNRIAQ